MIYYYTVILVSEVYYLILNYKLCIHIIILPDFLFNDNLQFSLIFQSNISTIEYFHVSLMIQ